MRLLSKSHYLPWSICLVVYQLLTQRQSLLTIGVY